ncbi:unnamed protein product [Camellia sinensis]
MCDLLKLLDVSSDDNALITTYGKLQPPLGKHRLKSSGKSYLAKLLRDLEVENGGDAPRIHSMDDYFMTEVEKVEENDVSKSAGSVRGKKPVMKKVMEYCYEPEMEEAYQSSMLKAFKKTLDEGVFSLVIGSTNSPRLKMGGTIVKNVGSNLKHCWQIIDMKNGCRDYFSGRIAAGCAREYIYFCYGSIAAVDCVHGPHNPIIRPLNRF